MLVPRTYHADGMVLFCDPADRPLLAAVLEVQRSRDPTKERTWKLYVAQLEAELARARPALVVLSAICHGGQAEVDDVARDGPC